MEIKRSLLQLAFVLISLIDIAAQNDKLAYYFSGIVYDETFRPVPYTHVVAKGTGVGDVTDSLGIFSLYIRKNDVLSFYNISFQDTSKFVSFEDKGCYIQLTKRIYSLREARVFSWGSSYGDFLAEVQRQGDVVTEGERIGLPTMDPDIVPFYLDDNKIKSFNFFIQSPLSSIYYNLSRREKGARKAFQLQKDKELIGRFEELMGAENISYITGLEADELERFMLYLNAHMMCTYQCTELRILTEIHSIWKQYQGL